jgi:alpha-tubulin suppressor-like RCC1 family protein
MPLKSAQYDPFHHVKYQRYMSQTLIACGSNQFGQLGGKPAGASHTQFMITPTQRLNEIKIFASGARFSIIITADNKLYGTGQNSFGTNLTNFILICQLGQLGCETEDSIATKKLVKLPRKMRREIKQVSCGNYFTLVLLDDNSVWATGNNFSGQLGIGPVPKTHKFKKIEFLLGTIKQIACGGSFSGILTQDHKLFLCGENSHGQLGSGDKTDKVWFDHVPLHEEIDDVTLGENHTIVITKSGNLYGCGYSSYGNG